MGDRPSDPKPVADHKRIDQFFAARWAALLGKLNAYKEGNGSLLDNTLIVIASDTTTAHNSKTRGAHKHERWQLRVSHGPAYQAGRTT